MPIYEFFCNDCRKRVEVFRRSVSAAGGERCPTCGGAELRRLVSRFAVHRSVSEFGSADEESYIDGLEDEDPRAMAQWARRMQQESGEDLGPEFDGMLSRMEAGELPDDDDEFDDGGFDGGDEFGDDF
ncbi:MAG TPA: zinc ribbon domain-containing protein [Dehalococcoidia bacterium]|nr:zinc ribbon domain-containing protein [Dehalococcoidia bacterium]